MVQFARDRKQKEASIKPESIKQEDKHQTKYICYNRWKLVKSLLREKYPDQMHTL